MPLGGGTVIRDSNGNQPAVGGTAWRARRPGRWTRKPAHGAAAIHRFGEAVGKVGKLTRLLTAIAVLAMVAACSTPAEKPVVVPGLHYQVTSFRDLPGWDDDDHAAALRTFLRSCERLDSYPPARVRGPDPIAATAGEWQAVCREARSVGVADRDGAKRFFERRFIPMAVLMDGDAEGMFTGYFEPELQGARARGGRYHVPLYKMPRNRALVAHDRARIDAGALHGKNLELLWVDDPIDAFFLQIQGSGRVVTSDGEVIRVGYAGQNGRPYFAIGRALIDRGEIAREDMSMQAIEDWLRRNPDEAPRLMALNRSYVFFRVLDGEGPVGALGVPLTPERSLAVDPSYAVLGGPVWLDVADPLQPGRRLQRLVIAQDTGGAIKGPIRGDLFWGHGVRAALAAGMMKSPGRYFLLVPRGAGAPLT